MHSNNNGAKISFPKNSVVFNGFLYGASENWPKRKNWSGIAVAAAAAVATHNRIGTGTSKQANTRISAENFVRVRSAKKMRNGKSLRCISPIFPSVQFVCGAQRRLPASPGHTLQFGNSFFGAFFPLHFSSLWPHFIFAVRTFNRRRSVTTTFRFFFIYFPFFARVCTFPFRLEFFFFRHFFVVI